MKTKTIIPFLFFLLIIPLVSSLEVGNYTYFDYYCDGDYEVENQSTGEYNGTDWLYFYSYLYNEFCEDGCVNNHCSYSSIMTEIFFGYVAFFSSVLLIVGALNRSKFFSLVAGMMILMMGVYITSEGMMIDGILYEDTIVRAVGLVMIVFSIFLFYSFIIDVNDTKKGMKGDFDE